MCVMYFRQGQDSGRSEAMDHQETIWIKKEETGVPPDEPGLLFLEDPLKTEVPGISIKLDPDLKSCMDSLEASFLEDPLKTEVPGISIKLDPDLKSCMDSLETNVVASTRFAPNSTRLIQNCGENCGISHEETLTRVISDELKITAEESTHSTVFDPQRRGEEETDFLVTRLKCSRRENEFNKFRCNFCLQSFASKYTLTMHVFIHMDGLQPPSNVCKLCGEVFPSDSSLNKHLQFSEGDQALSAAQMDEYECIYIHEHLFLEGGREFSVTDHTEQQSSSQRKTQAFPATGTRALKCIVCGESFTRMGALRRHTLIHTGQRPHKCTVCGKSFTYPSALKRHVLTHTGQRPHKCNVCGKSFTQLGDLNMHSLIHTGQRSHKCTVCGKSFTQLGSLKRHALIHTGQRPHKCNVCGKSFTHLVSVKSHALVHTGERPHKCNVCGKSFSMYCTLKNHVLIHTGHRPHKCIVCGKSYTQLGGLKRHALIHTGQSPYKCNVCGKSFTQSNNLKRHALIHTG